MNGQGSIGTGTQFEFEVKSNTHKADTVKGDLNYNDNSANIKLDGDKLSFLSVDQTATHATFAGRGSLDKQRDAYTFVVSITDTDKSGNHDTLSIAMSDNSGNIVYQKSGTVQGHIEIHKFSEHDDKSDSGIQH